MAAPRKFDAETRERAVLDRGGIEPLVTGVEP